MKGKKLISKLLILAGLVMVLSAGFSALAAETATQSMSFSNPITAGVTLTGGLVNFGTITPGTPKAADNAGDLTGTSNGTWAITVSGTDFTDGTKTIPIGRLSVRKGTDSFAPITTGGTALVSNHAPGEEIYAGIDYSLNVLLTDGGSSSNYTSTITYTISAN